MDVKPAVLESLTMLNEQMVQIVFSDHVKVDITEVTEVYRQLDNITAGRRVRKLLVIGVGVEITNAARLFIVEENKKRKELIIAEAVVVNSFAQKLSANFYIMFIQKIYPTHFFTDKDLAIEWLNKYN